MNTKKQDCFLALDLEMEQPCNTILSIGIAYTDGITVLYKENFLITPEKPVSEYIQNLTGLKNEMLDWNKTRKECFEYFLICLNNIYDNIHEDYRLHKEAIVWGCGDVPLLRKQLSQHGLHYPLSRSFINVKNLIVMYRHHRNISINKALSLTTACRDYKVEMSGNAHNSADDAENTIKLFQKYNEKHKNLRNMIENLKKLDTH